MLGKSLIFSFFLLVLGLFLERDVWALDSVQTARLLNLDGKAFSGSSINVVAGSRQTLYTAGIRQYTAYYREDSSLVLAKRILGSDEWTRYPTPFKSNLNDAHNTISLVVDGEGYIHLVWGQHNSSLNYARSKMPYSMDLVALKAMNEDLESSITYPQFFALPAGDLLFAYRDGGAGRGNLVLKHYDVKTKEWTTRQGHLIDGENKRSAYWDLYLDAKSVLHLAWNWRDTPDVASNHDLFYAQSRDFGKTWQDSDAAPRSLPLTINNAELVLRIPRHHKLMNSPVVAADRASRPYISSYWAKEKGAPVEFQVLRKANEKWLNLGGPKSKINFELRGGGTKHPPISRAALFVESGWNSSWPHLVYRDKAFGGKIIAASYSNDDESWTQNILVNKDVGAWEPSADPAQWQRMKQVHMLVQNVAQQDGNDGLATIQSSPIRSLVWSPSWENLQAKNEHRQSQKGVLSKLPKESQAFSRKYIKKTAINVADFHWVNEKKGWHYHRQGWGPCPLYIGSFNFAKISKHKNLMARTLARAKENNFSERDNNPYDADDYCVNQLYFDLYKEYGDETMRARGLALFDSILKNPSPHPLDWGYPHSRDRWSWSDALYMAPMSWLLASDITGDNKYIEFMHREWRATKDRLFSEEIGVYFRDESYFDLREANGRTVHWSRGTAWSIAGLAQIVQNLSIEDPHYPAYVEQLQRMASAFIGVQQADGLWRPGLLDPEARPIRETSGSAFIAFAFAAGINTGVLEKEVYLPSLRNAWLALLQSVDAQGRLRDVQPVGAAPHDFDPNNYEPFAAGAFLMLATELYKMAEY